MSWGRSHRHTAARAALYAGASALAIAVALPMAYVLMGAAWLIMKTEGALQERAVQWARTAWAPMVGGMLLISMATPWVSATVRERWFALPNLLYLWPLPALTALLFWRIWRSVESGGHAEPFFAAVGVFVLCFAGLAISNFPYLVPPILNIWQTAAAPTSQAFMLMGTLVLLPMVLGYTAFNYWLFRGKVRADGAYH